MTRSKHSFASFLLWGLSRFFNFSSFSFVLFLHSSRFYFVFPRWFVLCSYVFAPHFLLIRQYKLCATQCPLNLNLSSKRRKWEYERDSVCVCVFLTVSPSVDRLFTINKPRKICALNNKICIFYCVSAETRDGRNVNQIFFILIYFLLKEKNVSATGIERA